MTPKQRNEFNRVRGRAMKNGKDVPCISCGREIYRPKWRLLVSRYFVCSVCHCGGEPNREGINWSFFTHWSSDLAYFLGLMASDGYVCRSNWMVSFTNTDRCLVDYVARCIGERAQVKPRKSEKSHHLQRYIALIGSKLLFQILAKHGIHQGKSKTIKWPKYPEYVMWDFVRGLVDGDGSIAKNGCLSICSASPSFRHGLRSFLSRHGIPSLVNPKSCSIYLRLEGSVAAGKMMYAVADAFALPRKRVLLERAISNWTTARKYWTKEDIRKVVKISNSNLHAAAINLHRTETAVRLKRNRILRAA